MVSAPLYPESTLIEFLLVKFANGYKLVTTLQHRIGIRVAVGQRTTVLLCK